MRSTEAPAELRLVLEVCLGIITVIVNINAEHRSTSGAETRLRVCLGIITVIVNINAEHRSTSGAETRLRVCLGVNSLVRFAD